MAACAVLLAAFTFAAAQKASTADKDFVKHAMEGDNSEIQIGQLAQQKSNSADVKHFGEKLVTDHSKMNQQMTPIAESMGMTPPAGIPMEKKATIARLKTLSGDAFDKAFIEAMVKDHRKDLADFKKEAASASDPQLKQTVEQGSQVIAEHLQIAEDLAKTYNANVARK